MTGEPTAPASSSLEPGPALEALLRRVEGRARAQLAAGDGGAEEILALVSCIRELLRDRDALLEDLEALELTMSPSDRR